MTLTTNISLKNPLGRLKDWLLSADLVFFVFLVLVLNVSFFVKVFAVIFIYALRPDFRFGLRKGRLPLFYAAMMLLCVLHIVMNYGLWSRSYFLLNAFGLGYWLMSLLVIHQVKLAIEKNSEKAHRALTLFFLLNALVSFYNIVRVMIDAHVLNPYSFEGMSLKYHVSTGDWITGIFFDFSLTNSFINLIAVFYFLHRKNPGMSICCIIVMLMATSNACSLLLILSSAGVLLFDKNRMHKSMALLTIGLVVVFYARISPDNIEYTVKTVKNDSATTVAATADTSALHQERIKKNQKELLLTWVRMKTRKTETVATSVTGIEKEKKINVVINTIMQSEQIRNTGADSSTINRMSKKQERIRSFVEENYGDTLRKADLLCDGSYPGKIISFLETKEQLFSSVRNFVFGNGPGLFSSKLAFKASGVGEFGNYPQHYYYASEDFKKNHLKVYCFYFLQAPDLHSVTNNPFSSYSQLAGEYGIIGLLLFVLFYVWYFTAKIRSLTYGRIILPLCFVFLSTDYWFEHLSVLIIFELMLFLDLHKSDTPKTFPSAGQ